MKNVFQVTGNVSKFRESMLVLEDVEKGQPGLAVVSGRAGRGKSEAAKKYAVDNSAIYLPCMWDWTSRAMVAALCDKVTGIEHRSVDKCKKELIEALERNRRIVLVDEVDRLRSVDAVEHLRDVCEYSGAPIVMIGEESLYALISARRRLWSRVTQSVVFGPITVEDIVVFAGRAADLKLRADAANEMSNRSGGDFRLIYLDVRDLERMGRASGTQDVTLDMVRSLPQRKMGPVMTFPKGGR